MSFIRKIISLSLLTNMLSLFVIIAGVFSLKLMKREAFPNFSFDIVYIVTSLPGASPFEIEKLITIPIEDKLRSVSEIDEITSTSLEGRSAVIIKVDPDAPNKDKVVTNIQRAVDQVDDLPEDAEDPLVREVISGEAPIIEVAVSGDLPEIELQEHVRRIEDLILELDGVSAISRKGWREPEIWVEADPVKLRRHYVGMGQVVEAIRRRSLNIPAGTIKLPNREFLVRTEGELTKPEDYAELIVRSDPDGRAIRISDIGSVRNGFEDTNQLYRVGAHTAISLEVIKKERGDTLTIVDQLQELVRDYESTHSEFIDLTLVNDQSFFIRRRLGVLKNNAIVGIIMVLVALLVFLNWRVASMTALGIPIAFFLTFCFMFIGDISINLISMFGLIMVLGMIVDDAIIVAENGYRYIEEGLSPEEATVRGTAEVVKPVVTTILTTIAAFLPLMFMTGIFGKFVWQIPVVVIIALAASLIEAIFVLPSHMRDFARAKKKTDPNSNGVETKAQHWFEPFRKIYVGHLRFSLKHKYLVVASTFLILFGSILYATKMKFTLFPGEGIEIFFVRASTTLGTPLENTSKAFEAIEKEVGQLPDNELDTYVTQVGIQQSEPNDPLTKRGSNYGQITIYLTPPTDRERSADDIIEHLRERLDAVKGFENVAFERVKPGPPTGRPIAVQIKGQEYEVMDRIADEYRTFLPTIPGVFGVDDDYEKGKNELHVVIDEPQAHQAGLTLHDIGRSVRRVYSGEVASTVRTTEEEIDVLVRYPESYQYSMDAFDQLLIGNVNNRLIPFSQIATVDERPGINAIKHIDTKRVLTVAAEINEEEVTVQQVVSQLKTQFADVQKRYPGYIIHYGGEYEDTAESLQSLRYAFILSLALIFIILISLFHSISRPIIVMCAIPLGLIGVIAGFALHGMPLSFMCLLGTIGLGGVVVNDSIVLVEFVRRLRSSGLDNFESLVQAGSLRFRPVLLTTLTTVLGLLPVAYGIGGSDPFLKPAGLAISWGLIFGTGLILIIIPCLQGIADDIPKLIGWVRWMVRRRSASSNEDS